MAVSLAVAHCADTVAPLAKASETVKVAGTGPLLPSTTVASPMLMRRRRVVVGDGHDAGPVADVGVGRAVRLTLKEWLPSCSKSPAMVTGMLCAVWNGANWTLPGARV